MNNITELLKIGKIIIMPSDTVYGIFGNALNIETIKKIDEAKHSNKPHLIVVSSLDMLSKYVSEISDLHKEIINNYWPGPLTILFKKNDLINDELTKGSPYIAVRMPNNKFLLDVINEVGEPLISTSANITNENVITSVEQISEELKNKVDYIYDGGTLGNVSSTIIKIENNKIEFLREGELSSDIKNRFSNYI